jgi:hypothetical protein
VVLDANDVGADPVGSAAQAESNANNYTDTELQNYVQSVTGLDTDNSDPQNPVVQVAVDGVTITGTGTTVDPLVAATGSGGVQSVTGESVDITDPVNPVVNAWPLAGTGTGPQASGTIDVDSNFDNWIIRQDPINRTLGFYLSQMNSSASLRVVGDTDSSEVACALDFAQIHLQVATNTANFRFETNAFSDAATYPLINIINNKRWSFNGLAAPTVNDDNTLGYGVDSGFIHDGTLYICQDSTAGAAVWIAQGGGVQSVTGNIVDITDPDNPVVDQVQADWSQSNSAAVDFIKNKPTIVSGILWVPVSTSLTAANKTFYVNIANATYTDPTGVNGEGFEVVVEAGTATIGGVGYSVRGTRIVRVFNSSAWTSYVYHPERESFAVLSSNFTTTSDSLVDVTGLTIPVDANSTYAVEVHGRIGCSGVGGLRLNWTFPAGSIFNTSLTGRTSGVAAGAWQGAFLAAETTTLANNTDFANLLLSGVLKTAGTAGNLVTQIRSITSGQTSTFYELGIVKMTKIA